MEGQAFPGSYDLAPPPPSLLSVRLIKRDKLLTRERGKGDGRGAESYYRKKAWFSVNHLILSEENYYTPTDTQLHYHSKLHLLPASIRG
jgi:hypothetical protein